MLERFFESIESASEIQIASPIIKLGYISRLLRHIAEEDDVTGEIVIPKSLLNHIQDIPNNYNLTDVPMLDIIQGSVDIEFTLWVAGEEAGMIVYSDSSIKGLITNSTEDGVQWAQQKYNQISSIGESVESE